MPGELARMALIASRLPGNVVSYKQSVFFQPGKASNSGSRVTRLHTTQYIQLQSLHLIAHSYSYTETSIPVHTLPHHFTFHLHSNTWFMFANTFISPFMLNIRFANPINFTNTNVGPITHPYYTKLERK